MMKASAAVLLRSKCVPAVVGIPSTFVVFNKYWNTINGVVVFRFVFSLFRFVARVNGNNRVEHFVFVILKFGNSVQIPFCQFLVVEATRLNMSLNGGNVLF
jgi:hypothetical protein